MTRETEYELYQALEAHKFELEITPILRFPKRRHHQALQLIGIRLRRRSERERNR
jgi:hypothetical protein